MAFCVLLLTLCAYTAHSQIASDVPQGNWAYGAVQDLASKGLIKGYPPSGDFFGGRTVSRYEMAALIQRVLARMDDLLSKKADKGETASASESVTPDQLAEVKKLVDDYNVELTVMKTDMQQAKDDIAALQSDMAGVKTDVAKNRDDIDQLKKDNTDTKEGIQGAIDAINEQAGRIDKLNATKMNAGFGKIQFDGDIQAWYQAATNNANAGIYNGFRLRRVELKFSGNVDKRGYWAALIDPSKNSKLAGTGSLGTLSIDQTTNILQDAIVGWMLTNHLAFEIGQQKVPLGMEGPRSSTQLLTVERSIMNLLPVNSGRFSDIRDTGAMLRYASPLVDAQLAVFNGSGDRQNQTDSNNQKDIIYHGVYKGFRHFTLGFSQDLGAGTLVPGSSQNTLRNRLDAEMTAFYGRHRIEAEYGQARDGGTFNSVFSPNIPSNGGYLLYAYKMSPTWEFVGRGEYWNPNRDAHGTNYVSEYDVTLGANYYMAGHNSKIQLNWVRKNINDPNGLEKNVLGIDRNLFLMNFQQAF
jgi:hypothetical protein